MFRDSSGVVAEPCHLDGDLVLLCDLVDCCLPTCGAQEERTRKEKSSPKCGGFFFLLWLTRAERHPVNLANLGEIVAEHDVGELVGDVAVLATGVPQGANDDDLPILDLEGRCRERECLEPFKLLQLCEVYEFGGVDDRDTEVGCKISRIKVVVGGQSQFHADARGLTFGFCLESAPKGHSSPAATRAANFSCISPRMELRRCGTPGRNAEAARR